MSRQTITSFALACALFLAGCHHKVQNPMANIDSKQPDKVLFDRAMESMKHAHYEEARTLLENLINTYPESEYIARAKLSVGDSWYTEGGTAAWQQAEVEYKDFQTFFPNMPEAAEAQLKIASMHYRQMEKPDRDYNQAMRAGEEYKNLIQTYPDSPLVPEAKQRLREVQEVLAERQYRIAHFYLLRDNLAAAQARLQSLINSYPLYSGIDEALFELGELYEKEAAAIRRQPMMDGAMKERVAAQFDKHAIDAYTRIIVRYPAMDRVGDARGRLQALNAAIPTPSPEAMAQSKAEEQSRGTLTMTQKVMGDFQKHPKLVRSAKVGEPNMNPEEVASAAAMLKELTAQMAPQPAAQATQKLGIEAVGGGSGPAPGPNAPAPSSANTPAAGSGDRGSSSSEGAPPTPAPPQVNEVQKPSDAPDSAKSTATSSTDGKTDGKGDSSSKKKAKKGLRKLIPF
jgi:outer membrane protein assembly factor BamD